MSEHFELVKELGRGAMGAVWKARANSGEIVALKLLHPHLAADDEALRRFEREAEIASRLDSPRIVRVHGFGRREGQPYLAMDFVEGETLRSLLQREAPLPWSRAKPLLQDMAEALDVAHRAGVVHRDVKPANVMLDGEGRARMADFGIARALDQTALTGSSTVLGTPLYMAPEAEITARSDLYGLGCVAYEMLAGAPPFEGATHQQIWIRHFSETPDLGRLPEEGRALIAWLLQKDPAYRPQSASEVLQVLTGSVPVPTHRIQTRLAKPRRWPAPVALGSLVFVATAALAAVLLMNESGANSGSAGSPSTVAAFQSGTAQATVTGQNSVGVGVSSTSSPESASATSATPTLAGVQSASPTAPASSAVTAATTNSVGTTLTPHPQVTATATPSPPPVPSPSPTPEQSPVAGSPPPRPAAPSNARVELLTADTGTCRATLRISWDDNSTTETGFAIGPGSRAITRWKAAPNVTSVDVTDSISFLRRQGVWAVWAETVLLTGTSTSDGSAVFTFGGGSGLAYPECEGAE